MTTGERDHRHPISSSIIVANSQATPLRPGVEPCRSYLVDLIFCHSWRNPGYLSSSSGEHLATATVVSHSQTNIFFHNNRQQNADASLALFAGLLRLHYTVHEQQRPVGPASVSTTYLLGTVRHSTEQSLVDITHTQ